MEKTLPKKVLVENKIWKSLRSEKVNYDFNKKTGFMATWGKTKKDDPDYSPFGPFILDMEVSTVCSQGCKFCYKSNTLKGINMTFDTFKSIIDKMPKVLTQVAFGIGNIDGNPDLFKMFQYCRDKEIIPNVTINGSRMTDAYYNALVKHCGAVAVSLYDYDVCYNTVEQLTSRGMKQINLHVLLAEETYEKCLKVLQDKLTDPRLKDLNAIVFLFLKPKGDRNDLHQLSNIDKFKNILKVAFDNNIRIGFNSCSSGIVMKCLDDFPIMKESVEPCESTIFSSYVSAFGHSFPCSFAEEKIEEIDLSKVNDFVKEVWNDEKTIKFREKLLKRCRNCPLYDLGECVK